MTFPLIGLHAWFGEMAALMFLWAFIELFSASDSNVRRAKFAVVVGLIFVVAAWLGGGFYYVDIYGADVKPFIEEGPMPWAHGVVMETKEHVFLFIPFLAAMAWGVMVRIGDRVSSNPRARSAALWATGSVAFLSAAMALMGFLVSSGFRAALEQIVR